MAIIETESEHEGIRRISPPTLTERFKAFKKFILRVLTEEATNGGEPTGDFVGGEYEMGSLDPKFSAEDDKN